VKEIMVRVAPNPQDHYRKGHPSFIGTASIPDQRGKKIAILSWVFMQHPIPGSFLCEGPFYQVSPRWLVEQGQDKSDKRPAYVCPHMIEVGD
jgi:hypothetical protein